MAQQPEFTGKSVLVTGGGSGLGRATALAFASAGARVLIAGRREAPLKKTADAGPEGLIKWLAADVTSEADRARLIQETVSAHGGLDVLVNNAGILESGGIDSTSLEDWDRTMDINVRSVFALSRLAVDHLVRRRGSIVNISSVAGLRPYPGVLTYCVSKAAVDQFTRCLALELAPKNVRVNAVNPGVVVTNLHRAGGMDEAQYAAFLERSVTTHPLGRAGQPGEVASLVVFLASEQASWITGGTFSVDGGRALASAR